MRSYLISILMGLQARLEAGNACDAKARAALEALHGARGEAETRIAQVSCPVVRMEATAAARRRNWHPRSAVIAALAGWRVLRRHAAAATAVPVAGALIFGYAALPFIHRTPAPRSGHAAVRVHHRSRRPLAVITDPRERRKDRKHYRRHDPAGPPGGRVTGTPVHGKPPADPPPPVSGPVKLPVPKLPKLPPVRLPKPPPVQLPPVPVPPVPVPPVPVPPIGKIPGTVTGTAGGLPG